MKQAALSILGVLSSVFNGRVPQISQGDHVNLVRRGNVDRQDGFVVAQTSRGVLVEWPKGDSSWEDHGNLVRQLPDLQRLCA